MLIITNIKEWETLRGNIKKRATPEEIEEFWKKYNALTLERKDIIEDYSFYLKHREHRRPSLWEAGYKNSL